MPFLPLLEPILHLTPTHRSLCDLRLPWDQRDFSPWCARRMRACNMTASWKMLSLSSHFEMDPSPLVKVLEDLPSIVWGSLIPATLMLFTACLSSNHEDGVHVQTWLGSKSIHPYKFNSHKQWPVAQEKVLGPCDVFLVIQVDFYWERKVNHHLPPTRSGRSPWQTWWCLRKGNHSHVYYLEL